jgi:hypothetical protein
MRISRLGRPEARELLLCGFRLQAEGAPALIFLLLTLTAVLGAHQAGRPRLAEALKAHNVPVGPEIDDADQRITSYNVFDGADWFAIAYYHYQENDRLPEELRIRTFDRHRQRWRSTVIDEGFGSIIGLERHGDLFYVNGHYNPSAAPTSCSRAICVEFA